MTDAYALLRPLLFALPPERAHRLAIEALKRAPLPSYPAAAPALAATVFGLHFPSPVGMAAGFDKNGEVADALLARGFGFVEAGTVTPRPQEGNPRPRMFRLVEDRAVINRLGFNNCGIDVFVENIKRRRGAGIVGINIGCNRDSVDPMEDYALLVRKAAPYADYLTINISSPNTKGLRALQERDALDSLLKSVLGVRDQAVSIGKRKIPVLVKIAPDLDEPQLDAIAELALTHAVDGLIISNTTVARSDSLHSRYAGEQGGLSGRPLFALSTAVLAFMYGRTGGRIPLVGVGGISSGEDAYAKICAGASLVQAYTGFIYRGFGLLHEIHAALAANLARDGFSTIGQAVGSRAR